MQEEISFGAGLLRDLQDEEIPVSAIIGRILEWPPINQNPAVRKRLRWELQGFPEKERVLVKHFGRLVKSAGLWEPFFGPVEELETFIRIRKGAERAKASCLNLEASLSGGFGRSSWTMKRKWSLLGLICGSCAVLWPRSS